MSPMKPGADFHGPFQRLRLLWTAATALASLFPAARAVEPPPAPIAEPGVQVEIAGLAAAELTTDSMTDDELRKHRKEQIARLQKKLRETKPEKTPDGTVYRVFFCTLYYTPKESGFTAERGFDVTPTTAPGLGKRTYPSSFLKAVKKEGFGRLIEPVNERNYLQYLGGGGRYQFAEAPLGSRGNVLVPRKSCAISRKNPYLRDRAGITIDGSTLESVTGSRDWLMEDTGGGVHPLQIDLYWGEDEPRGSVGRNVARPAGTALEYAFDITVTVKPKSAARGVVKQ